MALNILKTLADPVNAAPPSDDTIALRRKYAAALLADKPVVAAPSQGIEALLEGLIGGRMLKRADRADASANAEAGKASAAMIAALMGPSAPASPGAPAVPPGGLTGWAPGMGKPAVPATPASGVNALTPDMIGSFISNSRVDPGLKSALVGKMLEPPYAGFSGDVGPDHVVYKDGKVVARGTSKAAEDPSILKTADSLYPRGSPEWKKFVEKNSGPMSVNTVDTELNAKGRANVDLYSGWAKELPTLDDAYSQARQLKSLLKDVTPGADAGLVNWVQDHLGITLGKDAGKLQAIQSIVSYMAPRMRAAGSGPSSDTDVALFLRSLPSILGTPDGNDIVASTVEAMAARSVGRAQIAQDYISDPTMTAKDAAEQIRKLADPFDVFKKSKYYTPDAAAPPPGGIISPAGPDGWIEIAPGVRAKPRAP